jgi:biotin transport system ATP-binding protein
MIEIRDVSHRFEERTVLHDVNLSLNERRIAVVGANGSGKSTFARLLNGLVVPHSGSVLVDGLDTKSKGREVRRRVGFVFQNPDNQIVYPIVEEDLAFGLRNIGISGTELRERIGAELARFGLAHLRDQSAHLLSGGEKQLLAIAGVLVMRPSCIVFDEPTTMLDYRNKRMIARFVSDLEQQVIMVTHDLDLIMDYDRVIVFDEGRVVADDRPGPATQAYIERMSAA